MEDRHEGLEGSLVVRFMRGEFWHPVLTSSVFEKGDVIQIDADHYEVLARGNGEVLVRPMSWIEVRWRRIKQWLSKRG